MAIVPNAVVISANPSSPLPEGQTAFSSKYCLSLYMRPYTFRDFGNETKEIQQLKKQNGWKEVHNPGKFYPKIGDDWYYFAYVDRLAPKQNYNFNLIASFLLSDRIFGNAVILISGPADSDTDSLVIHPHDIVNTVWWYRSENQTPNAVFGEREASRFARKTGIPPWMMPDQSIHFNM